MKMRFFLILAAALLLISTGCQAAPAATAAPVNPTVLSPETSPSATEAAQGEVVLTLIGLDGKSKDFTLEELMELPATEGQAGIKSSTGKITPPTLFKGVLLSDLLKEMGGAEGAFGIEIEAQDGYAMTFSSDQVAKGDFIAYDPATGDETKDAGTLRALIAYAMDGSPLDLERDGRLRLVVISDKNNQVTDGHWSIKWIRKITAKPLSVDWNLVLQGGIDDTVDRGSFESCSTSKCHQASWKDDKAQTWTGTPLFLFAGRADDEIKHGDGSFNAELALKGYTVEVVGKDGYSATFDIARLMGNKNILLANKVNDNDLTDSDFPLRLVGSDLTKKEAVGGVEKIILHFGGSAPAAAPEKPADAAAPVEMSELPEGKNIMVNGLVETPQAWSLEELRQMNPVIISVEVPKKGKEEVEGVSLGKMLETAGVKAGAQKIVFTASDGYSAEADLKDIADCKDCLVAFGDEDCLKMVLPGLDSGLWVREVTAITLK